MATELAAAVVETVDTEFPNSSLVDIAKANEIKSKYKKREKIDIRIACR